MDFLIDNTKLEGLIEFGETNNLKNEEEFLKLLKTSQLFVPVDLTKDIFTGLDFEGNEIGFDIKCLTADNGLRAVPLFTNRDILTEKKLETPTLALDMVNVAGIVLEGEYDVIVINPFTEMSTDISRDAFIGMFHSDYEDMTILDIIRDSSSKIDSEMRFYLRSDDDFMMDEAVDGIYVADEPLNVSSIDRTDSRYVNILEMPKSSKVLYIGEWEEANFDMIIAPESIFEHVRDISEDVHLWKCVGQPFFD